MQELDQLRALGDPQHAERVAARHKSGRETLGITPARLEEVVSGWRETLDAESRVALARGLWDSNIHEARIAAARLLVQARMRPDEEAWTLIRDWTPQIDGTDIGDAIAAAASRRLASDPARLDQIAEWLNSPNPWQRRGLLMATLPWAKMNHPKMADVQIRERVLDWALALSSDRHGAVRQAVETWLRDLTKHDAERVAAWHEARAAMPAPSPADPAPDPAPDQDL
ncbi:DNA alkylation repair protein [Paracoccus sp. (in: a-proteobacteria)]|uniref:DNA alkylation repair protein n=1 Tax=Paracoccus sp. TaxID=267 RepID=UPI00396CA12A